MEILDLRLVGPDILRALLEEETTVWREVLRWDYAATAAMVLRYLDSRALTGYAAIENGRAIGYTFYVVEHCKGLIGDAFVSPAHRDGPTELELVTHVVETLQATPGVRRIEAQLINLDTPAVRSHFLSRGFQIHDRQFLCLSVPGKETDAGAAGLAARPADLSIKIVPWDARWFQGATGLILASYRGHVDSSISDQYRTQAGAARFLENLVHFPGCGTFLPETSLLALGEGSASREHVCGMVLTSVVSDRVAHITQLCVAPEQQGQGLGRRLIGEATRRLRERKFQAATLTVTVSNVHAIGLYRALGFTPLSTFPAFAWDAPAQSLRLTTRKGSSRL
jgi:ribosomal protein S18 acetylase RimI-like enzyme